MPADRRLLHGIDAVGRLVEPVTLGQATDLAEEGAVQRDSGRVAGVPGASRAPLA